MEEATEELRATKTKLDTAETELTEAKRKLATAEDELETAKEKLASAQSECDNQIDNLTPKTTEKLKRAREDFTLCSNTVNSKENMVVSKQSVLTNLEIHARSLSAAAAPGKFER